jgi:broad specificity phosphatase PhoE
MKEGGDLLLVSHYNPTRCILGQALKLSPDEILTLRPKNACPYVLRFEGGRYELLEEIDVDVS